MDGTLGTSANDFPTDYDCIMDYLSTHKPTYVAKQGLLWARLTPMNNPHRRALELNRLRMDYHIRSSQPSNDLNVYPGSSQDTMDYNIVWDPVNNGVAMTMFSPARMKFITIDLIDGHAYNLCGQKYLYTYEAAVESVVVEPLNSRYSVLKNLGEGGFGTVATAERKADGKLCAVKMYKDKSPEKKKISWEISAMMAVLGQDNVVRFIEFLVHSDRSLYLVMEHAGNTPLDIYMKDVMWNRQDPAANELETRIITRQICLALAHVHLHRIIHRDMKFDNVMLTSKDPIQVKVIDFGLAIMKPKGVRFICGLPPCGNAYYAAPEMVTPETGFDEVSDSWSVGAMLFYMLLQKQYGIIINTHAKQPLWNMIKGRDCDVLSLGSDDCVISPLGRKFIKKLLEETPKSRLSTTKALSHKWLVSLNPRQSLRLEGYRRAREEKTAHLKAHPYNNGRS